MAQNITWPGSGSAITTGSTPFDFYTTDTDFITDAPKVADWCARRLGYPVVDVELQDLQFYACFEEAITEYAAQVNQFNIRNNLDLLYGTPTSSDATHTDIQGTGVPQLIRLSSDYGAEVGVGGTVDWKKGYVTISSGSQEYDLQALWAAVSESSARIEVKRVFHHAPPAVTRFFDPYALTGQGTLNLVDEFGFHGFSPSSQFLMMPIFEDMLRIQAIEFNEQIRKSQYSFELINNKLRVFPVPTDTLKVYFDYVVSTERDQQVINNARGGVVSDFSNAPYANIRYRFINDVGKQWIKKYTLALAKELLGAIREKYNSVPINDSEITLDGAALRSEAVQEKEFLVEQIRQNLEEVSRKNQMQYKAEQSDQHQQMLNKIPLPIYVG